ncbi:MAG: redoxin domain-containing protein [Planctomycetes bacterium]|nr:redoxin domain-containing protein [Planctomycetota bacterium]
MNERPIAPEFAPSLIWLDRPAPLTLWQSLRGEIVVLLFWRLWCVHGRHALADLSRLAGEFSGRGVAFVAIHGPALAAERDERRVRAELRALPQVLTAAIDPDRATRAAFAAVGNPALVLIDADGTICFRGRGEPDLERLRAALQGLLTTAHQAGRSAAVPFVPCGWRDHDAAATTALRQPGGLAVDPAGRLWVADTGNHRILKLDPDTGVASVIGSGGAGLLDGVPDRSAFSAPRGLVVHAGRVLVADAGNHALRALEPDTGIAVTVCGTGVRSLDRFGGGFGERQGLCSPVGLVATGGCVYVAQAGAHQLWQFDTDTQSASAWLGTGVASLRDGDETATLAQPFGLCTDDRTLWIADAGNGAVRAVDLAHGRTRTIATGLARPVGVAVAGEYLFVADAWRGVVVRLPAAGGEPVVVADAAQGLREPSALVVRGDELWIADAAAGCLWRMPLAASSPGLQRQELAVPAAASSPRGGCAVARPIVVRAFADVQVDIAVPLAADAQIDAAAPIAVDLVDEHGATLSVARRGSAEVVDGRLRLANVAIAEPGLGAWRLRVQVSLRRGDTAEPEAYSFAVVVPVTASEGGPLVAVVTFQATWP